VREQPYRLPEPCAGRFYVLKFFRTCPVDPCGELELDILRHLEHPNVVRVLGHGHWPDPERGYLYIVMEYVEGQTLLAHALEHNPSARKAAPLLLEAARALAVVHRQRVLHRDVKPDNLLVRTSDGKPVWVDFGVGHMEGRTTLPRLWRLPPGTPEYTSPEAYRFLREHPDEDARYQPGVADEVWAFSVTVYELLTDELPFGSRDGNPQMVKHIRTRTPVAPHERNPHVPVALSQVCMRMLEKEPGARLADMDAVAAVLEAALAGAGEDAGWDVPLMDPDAPQVCTTEEIPGKVVDRDSWERVQQQLKAAVPRRGRVRKARRQPPPQEGPAAAEVPLEEEERAGSFEALAVPSLPSIPLPVIGERVTPPAARVHGLARVRPARAGAVAVGVVLVMVLASLWAVQPHTASSPALAPAPAVPVESPPPGWLASNPMLHAWLVGELAVSSEPSEAGGGAASLLAPPPAPTFATMLRKNDARLKPNEKPAPRSQRKTQGCVPTARETCVVGICTILLTGCPGTPQVVRPEPRPADCPPGALKTMKELGINIGATARVTLPIDDDEDARRITVHEFTRVSMLGPLGKLHARLSGRLYFGADRVYGRFTEARTREGTYPVCFELLPEGGGAAGRGAKGCRRTR
jgi:eukaryotic-like serine/threonine-protein kinase